MSNTQVLPATLKVPPPPGPTLIHVARTKLMRLSITKQEAK